MNGTSMATPRAAGLVALHAEANPGMKRVARLAPPPERPPPDAAQP